MLTEVLWDYDIGTFLDFIRIFLWFSLSCGADTNPNSCMKKWFSLQQDVNDYEKYFYEDLHAVPQLTLLHVTQEMSYMRQGR